VNIQRLNGLGIAVTESAIARALETVSRMTPDDRNRVAGLYFVRYLAATWFLSDRSSYFAQSTET
jgi:hypothetical protein